MSQNIQSLTITRPDDWHLHLRDHEALKSVINHTAAVFGRAIVMPNLKPPVTNVTLASEYRSRILAASAHAHFEPLMTLYITDLTTAAQVQEAFDSGFIKAYKLYPAGATTNSDSGVTNFDNVMPALEKMAELGLPLLVHGEVTDPNIDIFDREAVFIDTILIPLLTRVPQLKVVLEHITTYQAAEFVSTAPANVAATLTVHHLLLNRNAMFVGGIRPHYYCLPILKREEHRQALVKAAISGSPKFFLGTDSAPHAQHTKEAACGCAGMYTAHAALPLYAEVFEKNHALDKLEAFASFHGPDFYGIPRNQDKITLVKEIWDVPEYYDFAENQVTPFRAGEQILWKIKV
jgi:dihydroorotase